MSKRKKRAEIFSSCLSCRWNPLRLIVPSLLVHFVPKSRGSRKIWKGTLGLTLAKSPIIVRIVTPDLMTEVIVEDIFKRNNVEFSILMMFKLYLTNKYVNVARSQFGTLRIFLPLRFSVRSILSTFEF